MTIVACVEVVDDDDELGMGIEMKDTRFLYV